MNENYHIPVMLAETIEYLNVKKDGIYCDLTLGGGGHFEKIAQNLSKNGTAIGIDRDLTAVNRAKEKKFSTDCKIIIRHSSFSRFHDVLDDEKIEKVDGFLMDLGVSSHQFDTAERGFSYRNDAKLDMRMNKNDEETAADIINFYGEEELTEILKNLGELRNPQRMARKLVSARKKQKIETTKQLVDVLNEEYGFLQNSILSKIFQAFRIAVNKELDELKISLENSLKYLAEGGRIVVISYHSLEDRIVKNFLRDNAKNCICPPQTPKCSCKHNPEIKIITKKPIEPKTEEININRRARSAMLRCGERIRL
ncbi:MAG: 16S rRNA (cytosine(1402)-N(4))-methyltransferase RsmH [Chitinispirillales bacterium]|nr:16S rRNA (cytosine(1402)-N(4))-methyltransferase RsmH [Chitinispirillales bacterium]